MTRKLNKPPKGMMYQYDAIVYLYSVQKDLEAIKKLRTLKSIREHIDRSIEYVQNNMKSITEDYK